ncbi:MAG: MMPL family transporter [Methanomassiliicoccales archaeon]|nr:MMPL family transporter [Methanomassiliicoccales archaeon]
MIFDRLAKIVTKRYKLIIVIWVIALLVSIPAMLSLNDVVSYDSDMSSGGDSESTQVTEIITENFQSSVSNGTILIVLQSDNMTDAEARDYILKLQQELEDGDLEYLESVSSIYSYSSMILGLTISELGPSMYALEENVNLTASLLYGIPASHLYMWTANTNSSDNVTVRDEQAYSMTTAELQTQLASLDTETQALALGYYQSYMAVWNSTATNATLTANPATRCQNAISVGSESFIAVLPVDDTEKAFMSSIISAFNLQTFSDQTLIHNVTMQTIASMAGIGNDTFLQDVYELGPDFNETVVAAYVSSIVANETISSYPVAIPNSLLSNFVSPSDKTMLMVLSFSIDAEYVTDDGDYPLVDAVSDIRSIISDTTDATGYDVDTYVTGSAAISSDLEESSANDMVMIEPITIIVILVLMGYMFRTLVGQFLPLGAVGVAVGVSQAMIYVLACTVMDVNYMISTMLFALLMGVGTDYSIFIVTRYREERMKGANREDAVHTSIMWAGESVATSASTVIIAFLAMATANYALVQSMGLIISGAIVIALLVALTLVPSILMLVGNRMFWPTTGKRWDTFVAKANAKRNDGHRNYFHKAATFSVKHAKVVLTIAIVMTIPSTYLYVTAETSFDFIGVMGNSESIEGMVVMTDDFGAGAISPTQVVLVSDVAIYNGTFNNEYLDAVENVTAAIAEESEVGKVTSITRPYGETVDYRNISSMSESEQEQLLSGMLSFLGKDNSSLLFTVVLSEEPQSLGAVDFIPELREMLAAEVGQESALNRSEILVGGTTAALYDTSQSTSSEFTNIEILVVIGIFIVLVLVLGSILLPAFAVLSIAMSITWAFALTYLVFGVWLSLPVLWIIPLILFVMLMGIGMDYNVFILTRIKEEIHKGKDIKDAIITAADWTGGIITALAIIMCGAFGALMLSSNAMLQEFGFALTVAVLLDAMVVRTYIVPAALTVMGKKAWWAPGKLQRIGREDKEKKTEQQK